MILDHVGFNVGDLAASRAFHERALAPLRIAVAGEGEGWAMFGRDGHPQLWIGALGPKPGPFHLAFAAEDRAQVRAFHEAALAAGGRDNGGPGIRARPHPDDFAAFVHDPDGHNVEAVCRAPRA